MAEVQKLGRDYKIQAAVERYDLVNSGTSDGTVGRGLDALKARISIVQSGQHVEYTIRVQHEGKSWTLKKRFNEIAAVDEIVKKRLPTVPELPAKSVVRQFSPEYLEARKAALTKYLSDLCLRRDVLNCPEVQQFFGLPEHCPASFGQPHASEPVQAAEVREAAFGIADFAYDPVQGVLLLGSTDASWTSRMDTKITNIKLPWEPAAPHLPTSQMSLWVQSPADLRFEMQFTCRYTAAISCVCLAMMRDKGLCLCGLGDGTVGVHHLRGEHGVNNTGNTLPLLRHTASIRAMTFDDAEQWLITASKDTALMVYDLKKQMIQCEVQTPAPTVTMRYCQAQKRLFTGLQNGRIIVWDSSTLPMRQMGSIPDGTSEALDMKKLAALDYDTVTSTIFTAAAEGFTLWTVKSSNLGCWGRKAGAVEVSNNVPSAVAWAGSSREIIAGFINGAVVVYDVDAGEPSYAFQAHKDMVTRVCWLDAPRRLLTASRDKVLKIWDFPSLRRTPLEEQASLISVAAPAVSMAPQMAPPGSRPSRATASSFPQRGSGSGSDPLGGRAPGTETPGAAARGPSSFDPLDPLGRGRSSSGGAEGYPSSSDPPAYSTPARLAPAGPLSSSATVGAAAPKAPVVVGARPGAAVRHDSDDDDDLAGWAR